MAEKTAKKDTLITKLDKVLTPVGQKLGNEKHLQAISNGMLFGLPFLVIGSFFLIIANPPINIDRYNPHTANFFMKIMAGWKYWAVANYSAITQPFNMTMGIFGVICAFGIGYELSKNYKRLNAATDGMISMAVYMMVTTQVTKNNNINLNYLGTNGMFVAIIIGLLSVEVTRFIERRHWQLKLPDSIPPMVATFINSLIPLLANIIVFYGTNLIVVVLTHSDFPTFVLKILTPATALANNLWGFILIVTLGNLLWLIGVNGSNVIFPIVFAVGIAESGANAALVAKGLPPTHLMNLQMFRIAVLGGSGNTIALILLMMRSKVEKFRTLGKLAIIPGICSINEPIIFGVPICFNPIWGIPFLISPIINLILTYLAEEYHLIGMGYIVDPSFTPYFAQAYMCSMDWRNIIFWTLLIIIGVFIYLPFFRVAEKNELEQATRLKIAE
ncbi:PTS system cellobiose-specific IIC component [Lactobacillus colini]|uniref:Permease IIC component n=1 Tax=Lactobacillus colini TaxID=1819254 RepID=A0ABS4MFP5_9LACO|nr:PTS transporter subunit EIIC [Lactobacillus colini]MBP2058508.1 PTS system cellobiose-specific IIC component [Lactobacillus colini]